MKKTRKIILTILLFFVIPLSITGLFSEFIYYTKDIEYSLNGDSFGSILIPFNFISYKPAPEYKDQEDGIENESAQKAIYGNENGTGTGLSNPNSLINQNLSAILLPESRFITSIDNSPYPCNTSGQDHRLHLGVSPDISFIIERYDNQVVTVKSQTWKVYTTKYPIDNLRIIDYISTSNGNTPLFNTKYVENIYCTTYTWTPDGFLSPTGKYSKKDTVLGYAPVTINELNNPYKPFFDPKKFVTSGYVKPDSVETVKVEGPIGNETESIVSNQTITMNAGETIQLRGKISPSNVTDDTIIYTSENENVASIDNFGKLTAISQGSTKINIYTANALVNKDIPKKSSVTIKVNDGFVLMPKFIDITNSDASINKYYLGSTYKLIANVTAADHQTTPINDQVVWSTSDFTIADIDNFGNVIVKDSLFPRNVIITATSRIKQDVKQDFIMKLDVPKADKSINGSNVYRNGKIQTNVSKNESISAKKVNIAASGYVYPDRNNVQILKGTADNNDNQSYLFNVSIESLDQNAEVTCYFEIDTSGLFTNEFTMSSKNCKKIDNTHYQITIPAKTENIKLITVIKAIKPVKYNIQYAGLGK